MDPMEFLILMAIIFVIDIIYLQIISKPSSLVVKSIQKTDLVVNKTYAFITYLMMTFTIYYFVILKNVNYLDAFLLGMVIYGIFNFTNLSIFNGWSLLMSAIDTLWGGVLFVLVSILYKKITPKKYINKIIYQK